MKRESKYAEDKSIIWEQNVENEDAAFWASLGVIGDLSFGVTGIVMLVVNFRSNIGLDVVALIESLSIIAVGLFHFLKRTRSAIRATTMVYRATLDTLYIEWGLLKKQTVIIPFSIISRLTLVKYDNSDKSTIFIDTIENIEFRGIDFAEDEDRPSPTLEEVADGDEVYRILDELRDLGAKIDKSYPQIPKKPVSPISYFASTRTSFVLAVLFFVLGSQGVLYMVDTHLLGGEKVTDKIMSSVIVSENGVDAVTKHTTYKGYVFTFKTYYNSPDVEIELVISPIYKKAIHVTINEKSLDHILTTNSEGISFWAIIITICFLLFSSIYMIYQQFKIPKVDSIFLHIGPFVFLLVLGIVVYYFGY